MLSFFLVVWVISQPLFLPSVFRENCKKWLCLVLEIMLVGLYALEDVPCSMLFFLLLLLLYSQEWQAFSLV